MMAVVFVLGLVLGAMVGAMAMALAVAAKRGDQQWRDDSEPYQ